jgi:hypothetical protein
MSPMDVYVYFVQRKERYDGQYAPDAEVVTTEWQREECSWFDNEVELHKEHQTNEIAGDCIVRFEVDQDLIRKLCLNKTTEIKAKMVVEGKDNANPQDS